MPDRLQQQILNETALVAGIELALADEGINPHRGSVAVERIQAYLETNQADAYGRLVKKRWDTSPMATLLCFLHRYGTDTRCPFRAVVGNNRTVVRLHLRRHADYQTADALSASLRQALQTDITTRLVALLKVVTRCSVDDVVQLCRECDWEHRMTESLHRGDVVRWIRKSDTFVHHTGHRISLKQDKA